MQRDRAEPKRGMREEKRSQGSREDKAQRKEKNGNCARHGHKKKRKEKRGELDSGRDKTIANLKGKTESRGEVRGGAILRT